MTTSAEPPAKPPRRRRRPLRGFATARLESIVDAVQTASNTEKVRAVLALLLVGVLVALQFFPSGQTQLTTAAETLAISVIAFYFGLHGTAPTGSSRERRVN